MLPPQSPRSLVASRSGLAAARHVVPGMVSLSLFASLLTLIDASFASQAYAAYGGVYIEAAPLWLWMVENTQPDRRDLTGARVCLIGSANSLWPAGRKLRPVGSARRQ